MCNVKYIENNFKKITREEMQMIHKGIMKLIHKIEQYEASGIMFENICNDDSVKYDILGNGFYILKVQTQKLPIRLLYRFIRKSKQEARIEIHKSYLKKHTDPQRYIGIFERYVSSQLQR